MISYTLCSSCNKYKVPSTEQADPQKPATCLICQLTRTQVGLEQELAATWQALRVAR